MDTPIGSQQSTNNSVQGQNKAQWLVFLIPAVVILIVVVVLYKFISPQSKSNTGPGGPPNAQNISGEGSTANPIASPAPVTEEEKSALETFFSSASGSWKSEYMSLIPEEAGSAYQAYLNSGDSEAKLNAAREFYIIINYPSVEEKGEGYNLFLNDLKARLAQDLGRASLFD